MIANTSTLGWLWQAAQDYTARTGQDGFRLSPYHLYIRLKALDENEARNRQAIFRGTLAAIMAAFGDDKAERFI